MSIERAATTVSGVERPHVGWWISIGAGMGLLGALAISDGIYGAWAERVTTIFSRPFLQWLFAGAVGLHVIEASVAFSKATRARLPDVGGWTFQTLLLGFPS